MFLDENSIALLHKLVLKLKNLLSLVHLAKKQRSIQGQFGVVWSYLESLFSLFDKSQAKTPVKCAPFKHLGSVNLLCSPKCGYQKDALIVTIFWDLLQYLKNVCTQQCSMTLCWDMKCFNKLVFNLCSRLSHAGCVHQEAGLHVYGVVRNKTIMP